MNAIILAVSLLLLSLLFIQDLKERSVSAWIFPSLSLLFAGYSWTRFNWSDIGINLLMVMLITLILVFYIRATKGTFRLWAYLGTGDILFWCCLCVLMSPVNYVLFFTGSLICTLLIVLSFMLISKKEIISIPLAGIQAALLSCCMLIALWIPEVDVRQTWLLLV